MAGVANVAIVRNCVLPRDLYYKVVESAKWLGALRTPIGGTLVAVNEALPQDAGLINRSPYSRGWLVRLEPENLEADLAGLVAGDAAVAAYETFMAEKKLDDCIHCEGYEMPGWSLQ